MNILYHFKKEKKSYYIISSWKKKAISFHKGKKHDHIVSFHEGKKPFDCKICKNIFTFWIELSEHIASFHKGKKHYHIVSIHERKKQFECKICQNIFTFWIELSEHMASFHKGKNCNHNVSGQERVNCRCHPNQKKSKFSYAVSDIFYR